MARPAQSIAELRSRAQRRLPRMLFDFVEGGAEDETTLQANRDAFDQLSLRSRVLVDVSKRSQRVTVAGTELDLPVLLAPVGLAGIAGRAGEAAAAAAASSRGTVSVVSTASSTSLERVAAAANRPQWFQLYPWGDRAAIEDLMRRARNAGYEAMVVTVDVPVTGSRERDARNGMTVPPRPSPRNLLDLALHPRWLANLAFGPPITFANVPDDSGGRRKVFTLAKRHEDLLNPGHTWDDLAWMREQWPGRVLLKGITSAEDAVLAAEHGCDGVIVSNHGGRQLDHLPATLRVLPEIAEAVGDRIEVLLDGGVRRGSDVVKALACGARAVLVGRPWMYGLGADGERGVRRSLEIFSEEIDRTLTLMGKRCISELGPEDVLGPPA